MGMPVVVDAILGVLGPSLTLAGLAAPLLSGLAPTLVTLLLSPRDRG